MDHVQVMKIDFLQLKDINAHPDIKRNKMTLSKNATYLGAFLEDKLIGCVGWLEFSHSIKLKAGFVLPEFRLQGVYTKLCNERFSIVKPLNKIMYANCTSSALPYHLKHGAIIIEEYKHPSYKIKYE